MLKELRQYLLGVTFEDMESELHCSYTMMPQPCSFIAYQMTVEYAYRNKMTLQQVLDIQRN